MNHTKLSKKITKSLVLAYIYKKEKNSLLRTNQKIPHKIYDFIPKIAIIKLFLLYRRITAPNKISTAKKINSYNQNVSYDLKNLPLFQTIEIETINRCNGKCTFCPVNIHSDTRPYAKMEWTLFTKIIKELQELNYSGIIGLFSNNEPFLDERLPEMLKYTKNSLPNAGLYLFTNGSLLTLEKFTNCINYLDYLVIDNYNERYELNKNPKTIYEYCLEHPELFPKIEFSMCQPNEILTNRGGQAPNKTNSDASAYQRARCHYPFAQLVIRPDGKVSLCCNDALGKYSLGDVSTDTLTDIWYSDAYMSIRKEMLENGRKNLKLCKNCDTMNPLYDIPTR